MAELTNRILAEIRDDLRDIKGDVHDLKEDVHDLKGDVHQLEQESVETNSKLAVLAQLTRSIDTRLQRLEAGSED